MDVLDVAGRPALGHSQPSRAGPGRSGQPPVAWVRWHIGEVNNAFSVHEAPRAIRRKRRHRAARHQNNGGDEPPHRGSQASPSTHAVSTIPEGGDIREARASGALARIDSRERSASALAARCGRVPLAGSSLRRDLELSRPPLTAGFVAGGNIGTDLCPGSQLQANADLHGLARPGQTPEQAQIETESLIDQALRPTDNWPLDFVNLGRVLHTSDDRFSGSHEGYQTQTWPGGLPPRPHALQDASPHGVVDAIKKQRELIDRFQALRRKPAKK